MAIWQDDKSGERHDDGAALRPGDEGFSRELAQQHFGHTDFSYVGTPNWAPPAPVSDSQPGAEPATPGEAPQGDPQ